MYSSHKYSDVYAEIADRLVLDGCATESTGDIQGPGFYALVTFSGEDTDYIAPRWPNKNADLTDALWEVYSKSGKIRSDRVWVLISENEQGFVSTLRVRFYKKHADTPVRPSIMSVNWSEIEKVVSAWHALDESAAL